MLYSLLTILLPCKSLVGLCKKTVLTPLTRNKSAFYKDFLEIQYTKQKANSYLPLAKLPATLLWESLSGVLKLHSGTARRLVKSHAGEGNPQYMQTTKKNSSSASTAASPKKQVSPVISPLCLVFSAVKWG